MNGVAEKGFDLDFRSEAGATARERVENSKPNRIVWKYFSNSLTTPLSPRRTTDVGETINSQCESV
jgi:hypothetical protein